MTDQHTLLQKDAIYRSIQAYFLHHLTQFKNDVIDLFDKNQYEMQSLKCMLADDIAANEEDFNFQIIKYFKDFIDNQKEATLSIAAKNGELFDATLTENKNLRREVNDLCKKVTDLNNQFDQLRVSNDEAFVRYEQSIQKNYNVSQDSNTLLRSLVSDVQKMKFDILSKEKMELDNASGENGRSNLAACTDFVRDEKDMMEILENVADIFQVERLPRDSVVVNAKAANITVQFKERGILDSWLKAARERRADKVQERLAADARIEKQPGNLPSNTKNDETNLKDENKAGQWRPLNPERIIKYERDFLLALRLKSKSLQRPKNLPNLEITLKCLSTNLKVSKETTSPKPPSQAVKPPSQAVKPPSQAVKPPSQAVKPPSQAVKPPSQAVKPPSQAVKPPSQVIKPSAYIKSASLRRSQENAQKDDTKVARKQKQIHQGKIDIFPEYCITQTQRAQENAQQFEVDDKTLERRQKQIDYGKNTLGYERYVAQVPRNNREVDHPRTPPKSMNLSRRSWDKMIKVWRLELHAWDPPCERPPCDKDPSLLL